MTLLRHYLAHLRAADAAFHARNADIDDSSDFFPPSIKLAATVFIVGLAVALVGIGKYAGWWL